MPLVSHLLLGKFCTVLVDLTSFFPFHFLPRFWGFGARAYMMCPCSDGYGDKDKNPRLYKWMQGQELQLLRYHPAWRNCAHLLHTIMCWPFVTKSHLRLTYSFPWCLSYLQRPFCSPSRVHSPTLPCCDHTIRNSLNRLRRWLLTPVHRFVVNIIFIYFRLSSTFF